MAPSTYTFVMHLVFLLIFAEFRGINVLPEVSFSIWVLSLPAPVCVSVYVCVCVNHDFVCAITHHPFKLGSPNLDQWCKIPWMSSLFFFFFLCGGGGGMWLTLTFEASLTWKQNFIIPMWTRLHKLLRGRDCWQSQSSARHYIPRPLHGSDFLKSQLSARIWV